MSEEGIGDSYQEQTKYHRGRMPFRTLDWSSRPGTYKRYPEAPRVGLPEPSGADDVSLDELLKKRRSIRDFSGEPVSLEALSYLLWATNGLQRTEMGHEFRTVPSAGALYPVETYLVVNRVEGLGRGVYHYPVEEHLLEQLEDGDFAIEVARAALDQKVCYDAGVVFAWTAVFERSKWKYEQRAYRYVYLDAGHAGENLYLAATALDLGACGIGALYDEELNALLGVDGRRESAIYMAAVGRLPSV